MSRALAIDGTGRGRSSAGARKRRERRRPPMNPIVMKRFDEPDEVRRFGRGQLEIVRLGGMTLGRATYSPGWKWSEHVRPLAGTPTCMVEHVGLVLSGACVIAMDDGETRTLHAGDAFHVAPGHDSW